MRFKIPVKIILIFLLFGLAPLLRTQLGYAEKPSFPLIWKSGNFVPFEGDFFIIVKHWLLDGWFPIFSWLGVAFLGGLLAELRLKQEILSKKNYFFILFIGIFSLGLGIIFWDREFRYAARGNYTELFYPPTLCYYAAYIGAILLLYVLVESSYQLVIYFPLRLLGVSPLFFYFMHFYLIAKFIAPFFGKTPENEVYLNLDVFLEAYAILILVCLVLALIILLIKKRFPNPPFLIRFFIGG